MRATRVRSVAFAAAALGIVLATPGSAPAGSGPVTPKVSAASQYVEMVPTARGGVPSNGKALKPPATARKAAPTKSGTTAKQTKHARSPVTQPRRQPSASDPVSAAVSAGGGGIGRGALLGIVLGALTICAAAVAVRRRFTS